MGCIKNQGGKSEKVKKLRKLLCIAIDENIAYIPIFLYSLVFLCLSFLIDVKNLYCLFFALISAFVSIIEAAEKFGIITNKNVKGGLMLCALIITILLLLSVGVFNLFVISGILSNIISGICLTVTLVASFISGVRDSFKRHENTNETALGDCHEN